MKKAWILLVAAGALVVGVYAYLSQSGVLELASPDVSETYYNLLVQGFRAGQLNLKKDVPPEFAKLADPYDPAANITYWAQPYRMLDLSYYKGRLFLYFGITPALILFWPYIALTGHYLFHRQAVALFCLIGFLASAGLLIALWRRYFAEVGAAVVAACLLALGLTTGAPILLSWSDVYEVPISCGYMLTMLALGAIWCALHQPERRGRWLAVASVAYGLAVGARPSLLFGAVILLVPVVAAWQGLQPRRLSGLLAAVVPITLIGLGLMLYNHLRFGNPFEFGEHYQIAGERQFSRQFFNLRFLWFNFRVYFLEPARWSVRSPFVQGVAVPPLPANYGQVRNPFGVLTNIPVVWLALAVPLAWRNRPRPADFLVRSFVIAVALLFGMGALTIGLFCGASLRYEVDFLPALVLLAVIGILGTERALVNQPGRRWAARCGWGLLLVFSMAFNLFATVQYHAEAHENSGIALIRADKLPEAVAQFEQAVRINPRYLDAQQNLAAALDREGKTADAVPQYEKALQIKPDYFEAHNGLAIALIKLGRRQEAGEHWEQALRSNPDNAEVHNNLGSVLIQEGNYREAITHFEQALRIKPDFAEAHNNLGSALSDSGRLQDAMHQWEEALRIKPDDSAAHYNLGSALEQTGRTKEAIEHYEQALRINPGFTEARNALTRLQAPQQTPVK